jgi:hypothetical protein
MKRYAIWDKQTPIITPIGEIMTPEEWIIRYPIAGLDSITVICAAGEINGGIFDTLGQMVMRYEDEGCDFTGCITPEEKLAAIEAFEDERLVKQQEAAAAAHEAEMNKAMNDELTAASLASIAASMEYQNMMTLPDEEV